MAKTKKYRERNNIDRESDYNIDWNWYESRLRYLTDEQMHLIRELTKAGWEQNDIIDEIQYAGDAADPYVDYDETPYDYSHQTLTHGGESNVWNASLGLIEPCQLAGKPVIHIPLAVWRQITAMTMYTQTEWLGYLDFTVDGGTIRVTGMTVPKQKVSVADVEPVEAQVGKGVIHAHPGGGIPSFSNTDEELLNPNNEFSIVISRDMKMTAVAKVKLPCGMMSLAKASVEVEGIEPDSDFYEKNKEMLVSTSDYMTPGKVEYKPQNGRYLY